MATKSASLKAFNTHFDEFIEDLINVFPDNVDIKSAKNITKMTRQVNVTLIIKVWHSYVYGPYKEIIDSGDLDFFIHKDYYADFNGLPNAKDIMKLIKFSSYLLGEGIKKSFPIRGAITHGE